MTCLNNKQHGICKSLYISQKASFLSNCIESSTNYYGGDKVISEMKNGTDFGKKTTHMSE